MTFLFSQKIQKYWRAGEGVPPPRPGEAVEEVAEVVPRFLEHQYQALEGEEVPPEMVKGVHPSVVMVVLMVPVLMWGQDLFSGS